MPRMCYKNASTLAVVCDMMYVEGFLKIESDVIIEHGFCMDGDMIIDPTIPDALAENYTIGAAFTAQEVTDMVPLTLPIIMHIGKNDARKVRYDRLYQETLRNRRSV